MCDNEILSGAVRASEEILRIDEPVLETGNTEYDPDDWTGTPFSCPVCGKEYNNVWQAAGCKAGHP